MGLFNQIVGRQIRFLTPESVTSVDGEPFKGRSPFFFSSQTSRARPSPRLISTSSSSTSHRIITRSCCLLTCSRSASSSELEGSGEENCSKNNMGSTWFLVPVSQKLHLRKGPLLGLKRLVSLSKRSASFQCISVESAIFS